jgi:hypothetical protein
MKIIFIAIILFIIYFITNDDINYNLINYIYQYEISKLNYLIKLVKNYKKVDKILFFTTLDRYISNKRKEDKPKIFLLVNNIHGFLIDIILYLIDDYNLIIIHNMDNITKNDIVIPIGVDSQASYYNNSIYYIFDNKYKFYKYITSNNILENTNINIIKSYDKDYAGENIFSKFIIKPCDEFGSKNQIREQDYIYNIINKYSMNNNNQIQEIINIDKMYEVNLYIMNGNIISSYCLLTESTRKSNQYINGVLGKVIKIPDNILNFCNKIIKISNYTGFIEFEFITDKNKLYIMECNPRISASVNNPIYFKEMIEANFKIVSSFANYRLKYNKNFRINESGLQFNKYNLIYDYFINKIYNFI